MAKRPTHVDRDPNAKSTILSLIDDATAPGEMSHDQAKEFLEELITDLQSRIEGINDDIRTHAEDAE